MALDPRDVHLTPGALAERVQGRGHAWIPATLTEVCGPVSLPLFGSQCLWSGDGGRGEQEAELRPMMTTSSTGRPVVPGAHTLRALVS